MSYEKQDVGMSKRLLVLNTEVSGMNKHLFSELESQGWVLTVINVPFPKRLRWLAYLISFRFDMTAWKKKFNYHLEKLYKSSWCFRWRTRWCKKHLKSLLGDHDCIFQVSSMFAPDPKGGLKLPYAVLVDYTMSLALKWDEWAPYESNVKSWIALEQDLYQNAAVIFTPSENTIGSLVQDYSADQEKIVKTGYGIDLNSINDIPKDAYDGRTVLFVGFDFERKGGPVLLEAFHQVRGKIPDAKLVIIGPSKQMYHIEQEGVEFLGPVNDKNILRQYFQKASMFVMPSLCEPFGFVFLEAMAHQLPCIGSTVDAMPEVIEDGVSGYLVDPLDANMLADKMCDVLCDQEKMRRMGQNAFVRAKDFYTWEQVGRTIDHSLSKVICHGG